MDDNLIIQPSIGFEPAQTTSVTQFADTQCYASWSVGASERERAVRRKSTQMVVANIKRKRERNIMFKRLLLFLISSYMLSPLSLNIFMYVIRVINWDFLIFKSKLLESLYGEITVRRLRLSTKLHNPFTTLNLLRQWRSGFALWTFCNNYYHEDNSS